MINTFVHDIHFVKFTLQYYFYNNHTPLKLQSLAFLGNSDNSGPICEMFAYDG